MSEIHTEGFTSEFVVVVAIKFDNPLHIDRILLDHSAVSCHEISKLILLGISDMNLFLKVYPFFS